MPNLTTMSIHLFIIKPDAHQNTVVANVRLLHLQYLHLQNQETLVVWVSFKKG